MGEISAIAVRYFKTPLKAGLKASMAKQLGDLIAAQPAVLAAVPVVPAAVAPGAAAPPAAAAVAPGAAVAAVATAAAPDAAADATRETRLLRHLHG